MLGFPAALCLFRSVVPVKAHHNIASLGIFPKRAHFRYVREVCFLCTTTEDNTISDLYHITFDVFDSWITNQSSRWFAVSREHELLLWHSQQ